MSKHNISKSNKQPKNKSWTYCYMVFSFNKNDDIRLWHDVINLALFPPPTLHIFHAHIYPSLYPFTPLYPSVTLHWLAFNHCWGSRYWFIDSMIPFPSVLCMKLEVYKIFLQKWIMMGTELFEFSCYTGEILKIVKTGSERKIILIRWSTLINMLWQIRNVFFKRHPCWSNRFCHVGCCRR